MKAFAWGLLAGYAAAVLLPPVRFTASLRSSGRSPRSDRPPGMTGGGPGWLNNPGM